MPARQILPDRAQTRAPDLPRAFTGCYPARAKIVHGPVRAACVWPEPADAARIADSEVMRAKRTSLVHIIYFSRLNLSADPAKRSEQIGEIGRVAQKKNEFSVITSFLIIEGNFACQVIEGERSSVHETFDRVSADQRHRDVQINEWREIAKREFVHSFKSAQRTAANDSLFAKANLLPMLQRGTPKATAIHALCLALQNDAMSRQGIDHLFI
ncbi:MAG: BLUF domain-containing protein [Actinoplanes sp.]